MQLSLNWLKEYVDIPKKITPAELGRLFTLHTVEVEKIISQAEKYKNVIVGKILEIKKHPAADRLQLVKVDIGREKIDIVCGAGNIKVKQFVPVALAGAILPSGLEIKEVEVRGEKSSGMLCAPDELMLGDDHSGILILEKKAKAGMNFSDYLGFKDIIFEVDNKSITHRGDLWCHYGMAREIAAFLKTRLKKDFKINQNDLIADQDCGAEKISVKIEDQILCPRYMAVAIDNIKIFQSPKWLEERLVAAGMRPINNIVDITNYVMLELGQPLHAFDKALIAEDSACEINVRKAKKGEAIKTIDGEKRELDDSVLVIADKRKALAIAGIIGGEESGISDNSTAIILESANFNAVSIRKTAQKMGLRTESSTRFEKSLDPINCELALGRAVELIKSMCPQARVASNLVDENKFSLNQEPIELDLKWLYRRLGEKISESRIIKILVSLGFGVKKEGRKLRIAVPTWRAGRDISLPEDLVEEVARIYGYDNIAPKMPLMEIKPPIENEERKLERKIKIALAGAALTEVYNYSFVDSEQLKKIGVDPSFCINLKNPIALNQSLLRRSLLPNLINNIRSNQARYETVSLFEIGSIFSPSEGDIKKNGGGFLPFQEKRIGIIIGSSELKDVYRKIKGIVEFLISGLNLSVYFEPGEEGKKWLADCPYSQIAVAGKNIGFALKLNLKLERELGLKKEVAMAEINFKDLLGLTLAVGEKKYKEPEKFPLVRRDLAFVIDFKIPYNKIKEEIIASGGQLIKEIGLFDVYEGEKLGKDKRSLAFHINYGSDRTLTSAEVDEAEKKLIKNLEEKFGAQIRNF
jgi:phenylalanyl-tRNA synthetase beta chain